MNENIEQLINDINELEVTKKVLNELGVKIPSKVHRRIHEQLRDYHTWIGYVIREDIIRDEEKLE